MRHRVLGTLAGALVALACAAPAIALEVGDKAPDFTLPGPAGKPVKLSELTAKGPVVVYTFIQAFTGNRRNLDEIQMVLLGPSLKLLHLLHVRGVHFGGDDDLGFFRQVRIVFAEFRVDCLEFIDRIPLVFDRHIDEMQQNPRSLDMSQELNA